MNENYAGVESSLTYSATLNNEKVVTENDQFIIYTTRSGMRGMVPVIWNRKSFQLTQP